ncbi:MAG: sigma-70 family RNA polymerase sigma factor [Planctomycetes bacterium]|nr:sigma-70 family RNA polymerase sigma factor [Planctomycetota bacterium]
MPPDSSEEIRRATAAGDTTRAIEILTGHLPLARRMAHAMLGPNNLLRRVMDSEDLTQETLARVLRAASRMRAETPAEVSAYLAVTMRNTLRDSYDKARTEKNDIERETRISHHGNEPPLAKQDPSPSQEAVAHETEARLMAAIDRLPANERDVIVLRRKGNLEYDAIARQLELPSTGAARALLARATSRLSTLLLDNTGNSGRS